MDIQGPSSISTNQVAPSSEAVEVQISLGGNTVTKMPSLSKLIQDLQDEISFFHSERVEDTEDTEEGVEDRAKAVLEQLIKRIREVYASADANNDSKGKEQVLSKLRSGEFKSLQQLLEGLEEYSSDHGEQFALLLEISDSLPAGSDAAKLVTDAIENSASVWEHELIASSNTLQEADILSKETGVQRDKLQRAYQDSVVAYESVIKSLATLVTHFGIKKLEMGSDFLQEAARSDLAAFPSSVEKELLEKTLIELQGMKVLHTLKSGLADACQRASELDSSLAKLDQAQFSTNFFKSLHDPTEFDVHIKQKIATASNIQNRILLLQDLKDTIAQTPPYYFKEGGHNQAISPWQTEIDNLIYKEAGD